MKTIICHSFPAWDTPYIKSTMEIMTRLAKEHRVIMLDYHYTWKDVLKNKFTPKSQVLGKKSRSRKIKTENGLVEVYNAMPVLPVNWINNAAIFRLAMFFNAWFISLSIKKILKTVDRDNTVLVNAFNPIYGYFTRKYWGEIERTYYCYDEISGTEWASKWGAEYESKYIDHCDRIITTSEQLKQKFIGKHANVSCVKNGVNLSIFRSESSELTKNYKVGYVGAIDQRVDLDLLAQTAKALTSLTFEMLGPVKVELPENLPENIIFRGSVPQKELPESIQLWDACIIPFVKTELTKAIYPLKINEYMAMGKPVITTDFSDLSDFDPLIYIAENTEDFIFGLKKEIQANNRLKVQMRKHFAQQNSWEARADEFEKQI